MKKQENKGKVYLVGTGTGDPELMTLKSIKVIEKADTILYDRLGVIEILDKLPDEIEKIDVGKDAGKHKLPQNEINELLVKKAKEGKTVVRLKGGDPYLFGRGGEEAEILIKKGIEIEVIPGITSAIAVPELVGIPVTHRDYASMVTIVTGHEGKEKVGKKVEWDKLAKLDGTLVILMGIKMIKNNCESLLRYGKDRNTPVAVIEKGTMENERVVIGNLKEIAGIVEKEKIKSPAIIVIGDVVRLYNVLGVNRIKK